MGYCPLHTGYADDVNIALVCKVGWKMYRNFIVYSQDVLFLFLTLCTVLKGF
jgi:hypothetical protein